MSRRRNKLPADPVAAKIESLSHEGRGIARIDGKTVFIDGALPGEHVLFKYSRKRAKHAEGYVVEILDASVKRSIAKCPHYGLCGGCSMQHMSSEDQILHKESVLLEQLQHIGGVQPEQVLPPLCGPEWAYRRKARLGVKYVFKKEKLLVGFREKRSSFVADIERCEVLHTKVGDMIPQLQSLIMGLSIFKQVPQIEVAVADNRTALIFRHLVDLTQEDKDRMLAFQQETDISVYLQSGGPSTVEPLDKSTETDLYYELSKYGLTIHFRPDDFTQVNFEINIAMIERVLDLLCPQSDEKVLDLFCGLGNFSLPLAKRAATVCAIEGLEELVSRARQNAEINNIQNASFHAMDLMRTETGNPLFEKPYHKILLDPPRSGALEIIQQLDFSEVEKVVYVSCNPATLARDAGILVKQKGLKLVKAGVMDMFPHTSHVESIALFEHA